MADFNEVMKNIVIMGFSGTLIYGCFIGFGSSTPRPDEPTARQADIRRDAEIKREAEQCAQSLDCYASKYQARAGQDCRSHIERSAKNNFQWTNGTFDPILPRAVWLNQAKKSVTYVGDKIKYQNGFGAWIIHSYECDYSPEDRRVLAVRVSPGQL